MIGQREGLLAIGDIYSSTGVNSSFSMKEIAGEHHDFVSYRLAQRPRAGTDELQS